MRDYLWKWRNRLALRLLGLPKDTAGVWLPGTITFPAGMRGVRIEGCQFHSIRDVPGLAVESERGVLRVLGGAA